MNKKEKKMSHAKDWKTVGIEGKWLDELRKEADKNRRSAQEMLCLILEERYTAPK
jgi:hypothetical protein